jgi:predicted RNA-binding Zn-ribbon protein involved in translation (DUF1610 family)
MSRRLLNLLTVLSLLLCMAVCVLWARSYFRSDWLCYTRVARQPTLIRSDDLELLSGEGNAWVAFTRAQFRPEEEHRSDEGWAFESDAPEDAAERVEHRAWGFGYEAISFRPDPPSYRQWGVAFPLWLAAALFAAAPATTLVRRFRRRRAAAAGRCTACGYELTANISGLCPECGRHSVVRNREM